MTPHPPRAFEWVVVIEQYLSSTLGSKSCRLSTERIPFYKRTSLHRASTCFNPTERALVPLRLEHPRGNPRHQARKTSAHHPVSPPRAERRTLPFPPHLHPPPPSPHTHTLAVKSGRTLRKFGWSSDTDNTEPLTKCQTVIQAHFWVNQWTQQLGKQDPPFVHSPLATRSLDTLP